MTPPTVLSLGSINADFQMRVDAEPGSRDLLQARDFARMSGGKSANTAFIAARFGLRSLLLGRVGDDQLAEQALGTLAAAGVDISGVSQVPGTATAVSIILVPPDAKKQIVLATNANDCWDDTAIQALLTSIDQCPLPGCIVLNCEIPPAVVRSALGAARKRGLDAILDPSFAERFEPDLYPLLRGITPNAAEAGELLDRSITSVNDAAQAARALHAKGVAIACVKLSDGGCVVASADRLDHIPAGEVNIVDTTGAGDAFTAAFAVALLEGCDGLEAAAWGVASANLATTGYGSQPSYQGRAEITALAGQLLRSARTIDV